MEENRTIVVGVDYSEPSKNALKEAARLANATVSRLVCVHVIDQDVIDFWRGERDYDNKEIVDHSLKGVEDFVRDTIGDALDLRVEVLMGNPLDEMLRIVGEEDPQLVVLGANGCDGSGEDRVGVLATQCVRSLPCSVMLIKGQHNKPFKSLLVCVDFTENSIVAADRACELAMIDKAKVHLMFVYRPNPFGAGGFASFQIPDFSEQEVIIQHEKRLKELCGELREKYPELEITTTLKSYLSVKNGLEAEIENENVDLAFIGRSGKSTFKDLILGTIAERLLHQSSSSIYAVKPE